MKRVCLLVLDSLGIGGAPDAEAYGDLGADTLGHIALACRQGQADVGRQGPLRIPTLVSLGLGQAAALSTGQVPAGLEWTRQVIAKFGCAKEISRGKDTPSGHFEMTGAPVLTDWGYFESAVDSVPDFVVQGLIKDANLSGVLGNCKASGTELLVRGGEEHVRTGSPIIYTSVDSVLQIAAHEVAFGLERLYEVCRAARRLVDGYRIARVIARPFVGQDRDSFVRTGGRRDFSMASSLPTLLDVLVDAGGSVTCVGKVADIFAGRGVSRTIRAYGHDQLMAATCAAWDETGDRGLVMTNFVDFDTVHGHRRDVAGYAGLLEAFDRMLPSLLGRMTPGDLCIITADHGCDPTWPGTDHTREQVPILAFGPGIAPGSMGRRQTLADIGASVAHFLDIAGTGFGQSFLTDEDISTFIS